MSWLKQEPTYKATKMNKKCTFWGQSLVDIVFQRIKEINIWKTLERKLVKLCYKR